METFKQRLFTGWNFMRWLRLVFGAFFIIQFFQMHDTFMGLAGAFFLITALTNTGCCGAGQCAVPIKKMQQNEVEEIPFEEIK